MKLNELNDLFIICKILGIKTMQDLKFFQRRESWRATKLVDCLKDYICEDNENGCTVL